MKRWKIFAGIFLVFALGVVSGVLGTGVFIKHRVLEFRGGAPFMRDRFLMHRLTRELDLTGTQQEKIGRILKGMRTRHQDFFRARRAEMTRIIDSELAVVKKELTAGQQDKLDRLLEKFRRHRRRFHDTKPPPGPVPVNGNGSPQTP